MAIGWIRRQKSDEAVARMKATYDAALTEGAVLLVEQVSVGSSRHYISESARTLLGIEPLDLRHAGALRSLVHPDDASKFGQLGSDTSQTAPVIRLKSRTQGWRSFRFQVADVGLEEPLRLVATDVTADDESRQRGQHARRILDLNQDALVTLQFTDTSDPESLTVLDQNPATRDVLGLSDSLNPAADSGSEELTDLGSESDKSTARLIKSAAFDCFHTGERLVFDRVHRNRKCLEVTFDRLGDSAVLMRCANVTDQVSLEDTLRQAAHRHTGSGLPTRALLEERLGEFGDGQFAVIVSEFRSTVTDDVLRAAASRLESLVPAVLTARLSSQSLATITQGSTESEQSRAADRVQRAIEVPFYVDGRPRAIPTAVGGALLGSSSSPHAGLRAAIVAAEKAEVGFSVTPRIVGAGHPTPNVIESIPGPAADLMELRYQPILELRTGRVAKVEALVRWKQSAGEQLGMLELAERAGITRALTQWTLAEAMSARSRLANIDPNLTLTINMGSMGGSEHIESLLRLIRSTEPETGNPIEIEIAESAVTEDPLRGSELVSALVAAGASVVIDDFGSGYSSLSSISALEISGLKIDCSYVATISAIPADAVLVLGIIEFCHRLGLTVAAVGVGDQSALAKLRDMNCDLVQGFLFSEPVVLSELGARVAELETAFV